jgi:hypothetical protein
MSSCRRTGAARPPARRLRGETLPRTPAARRPSATSWVWPRPQRLRRTAMESRVLGARLQCRRTRRGGPIATARLARRHPVDAPRRRPWAALRGRRARPRGRHRTVVARQALEATLQRRRRMRRGSPRAAARPARRLPVRARRLPERARRLPVAARRLPVAARRLPVGAQWLSVGAQLRPRVASLRRHRDASRPPSQPHRSPPPRRRQTHRLAEAR